MPGPNDTLLRQLEALGTEHDARTAEHDERLLNITRDTGEFLALLICATRARRILELGTSNGYSTLWLAEAAAATGGAVTTVELRPAKAALARETFQKAVAIAPITLEVADGGKVIANAPSESWDFIFLDSDRAQYAEWWPHLRRALAPGGLIVVDNSVSHAADVARLIAAVEAAPEFTSVLVPIGKGEFVAYKSEM